MANRVVDGGGAVLSTRQLILAVNSHFARATSLSAGTHRQALSCTQTQRALYLSPTNVFTASALCANGVMANESGRKAKYKYTHTHSPFVCDLVRCFIPTRVRVLLRFY